MKKVVLFLLVCSLPIGLFGQQKPNILVLLTDDIGWGDPACYNPNSKIDTPSIDRLAAEGMLFTHAHTPAALCAPTRYSMLSGNYSWRGREAYGVWRANVPSAFTKGQQSVATMLKSAGYRTAMFGKAGIGGFYASPGSEHHENELAPIEWGFDYSWIIPKGHQSRPLAFFENGVSSIPLENGRAADWDHAEVGASLLAKAQQFLDDHVANHKDKPFYIHFCSDGAHSPWVPADTLAGRPLKGATEMTEHTDMIHETDILLGALVDALDRRGMRENTLVIYTSDNGGLPFERELGHDSVAGLRGRKHTIFEGGSRVPFIASWPGRIPGGTVRHQVIGTHDVVATALELAGIEVPDGQALDSVSLAPVLFGRRGDDLPVRDELLVQSSQSGGPFVDYGFKAGKPAQENFESFNPNRAMAFALYQGDWKLVVTEWGEPAALYDLSKDLGEENNLINDHPERVAMMADAFRENLNTHKNEAVVVDGKVIQQEGILAKLAADRFHFFVRRNNIEQVKSIISLGVDVNARDSQGLAPTLTALYYLHLAMTDLLLEMGADTSTPYMMAYTGNLKGIKRLMEKGDTMDSLKGLTLLHAAAAGGHTDVIQYLIDKGFEVTATTEEYDLTPLHYAALGNHQEAVEILMAKGTPLDSGKLTPLFTAAYAGHQDMIEFLMLKGADINKGPETALHITIRWGDLDLAKRLLEAGADSNARDEQGNTPLHRALEDGGQLKTAKLLVSHGADVNAKNNQGESPLSMAKKLKGKRWVEFVEFMSKHEDKGD